MKELEYDSQYSILKDQIRVLGGNPDVSKPDSCYEAQLEILRLLEESGESVTPEQVHEIVEEYNYTTMADVEAKKYMQQKKLTLNGDATAIIDEEGNTLTYTDVKVLVDNKGLFVYLLVDNAFYIPCGDMVVPSGHNAVEFSSAFIVAGEASIARIIIDTENEVIYEQYWLADKDWIRGQGYLTEHQPLKTINGESVVGEGDIEIKGGGADIIEITQAEYDALSDDEKHNGKIYSISDATIVNINDYLKKTDADTKYAQKTSVSASTSGYKFPTWNAGGVISGTYATAYQASQNVNGSSRTLYSTSSSSLPTIYAPTSAGTKGQILSSNGSGAPVWSEAPKSDATTYLSDADMTAGNYTSEISAFYRACMSAGNIQPVQIIEVEHDESGNEVYSQYLPSSTRFYGNNVEIWLMYTEDGVTWTRNYYLITNESVTKTVTTGTFGG